MVRFILVEITMPFSTAPRMLTFLADDFSVLKLFRFHGHHRIDNSSNQSESL